MQDTKKQQLIRVRNPITQAPAELNFFARKAAFCIPTLFILDNSIILLTVVSLYPALFLKADL